MGNRQMRTMVQEISNAISSAGDLQSEEFKLKKSDSTFNQRSSNYKSQILPYSRSRRIFNNALNLHATLQNLATVIVAL